MTAQPDASLATSDRPAVDTQALYFEGMVAGAVGAAVVALWFLAIDTFQGRPFYTPAVLGTALFRRGAGLASPETLPVSFEMVAMFTWVHWLVFAALGGIAARLLGLAERNPNIGFGVILLFVVFQAGFMAVAMLLSGELLQALGWPAVFGANLLAAAAMGCYFWLRHPNLRVRP